MDFNEDFSAFHAQTLREQALFVSKAVRRVLEEYDYLPQESRPNQVTLLGHSMGGIVARLALIFDVAAPVDVLLTMSTPHVLPPATLEYGMESLYREISHPHGSTSPLLISVCGGVSDSQIVSDGCVLPREIISAQDGFAVFTTGIPGVWTGVDHQAMMWCHQLRWRIARVLLDMTRTPHRQKQLEVAEKWLLGRHLSLARPSSAFATLSVRVTSRSMTVLVWSPITGFLYSEPEVVMQWCKTEESCRNIEGNIEAFPQPGNDSAPFPLLGEGIKAPELAFAITLELEEAVGMLKIDTPKGVEAVVGPRKEETVGHTWGKHVCQGYLSHLADTL